ncbi:hypothetical protein DWV06_17730 [Anaerosacchariphilus polymeriproducens]|uniref:Uncharacterized protein n=1 Tax=Anaerosacchariphilus polymeriproducens TaxID=1812858 RepID=A0A371AQK5_9FIRM|nr:hypothetical protein DWV06_17730 [Anaerosacchariphilus polymeriproducens]
MKIVKFLITVLFFVIFIITYPLCNYYADSSFTCLMIYIMYVTLTQYDMKMNQMFFLRLKNKRNALYYYIKGRSKNTLIYLAIVNMIFWIYMKLCGVTFTSGDNLRFICFNLINLFLLSVFYYLWILKYGTAIANLIYIFIIVTCFIFSFIYTPIRKFSFLIFAFQENKAINVICTYIVISAILFSQLRNMKRVEVKI